MDHYNTLWQCNKLKNTSHIALYAYFCVVQNVMKIIYSLFILKIKNINYYKINLLSQSTFAISYTILPHQLPSCYINSKNNKNKNQDENHCFYSHVVTSRTYNIKKK